MKTAFLLIINVALVGFFIFLLRKRGLLTFYQSGRFWLTWFAVAIITLMDELTSVFYAPAEAFRFIGPSAIIFIAFTSIFIHYMTTRLVEISRDSGASRDIRRRGLFLFLPCPGAGGVVCGGGVYHGGLHSHGLHILCECYRERHLLLRHVSLLEDGDVPWGSSGP